MSHTRTRRRSFATGTVLPSGTIVRPEPRGKGIGFQAKIGNSVVQGLGYRRFWENVGKLFRNRAAWAERNRRPPAVRAEFMLDAFAAEDLAMTFEKPKGAASASRKS